MDWRALLVLAAFVAQVTSVGNGKNAGRYSSKGIVAKRPSGRPQPRPGLARKPSSAGRQLPVGSNSNLGSPGQQSPLRSNSIPRSTGSGRQLPARGNPRPTNGRKLQSPPRSGPRNSIGTGQLSPQKSFSKNSYRPPPGRSYSKNSGSNSYPVESGGPRSPGRQQQQRQQQQVEQVDPKNLVLNMKELDAAINSGKWSAEEVGYLKELKGMWSDTVELRDTGLDLVKGIGQKLSKHGEELSKDPESRERLKKICTEAQKTFAPSSNEFLGHVYRVGRQILDNPGDKGQRAKLKQDMKSLEERKETLFTHLSDYMIPLQGELMKMLIDMGGLSATEKETLQWSDDDDDF